MSKSKRGKSASGNEISKWETELIQAQFNEESWRSCVFFIAPGKFEDNSYVDILSDVVATGLRKLFSVITEENLLRDVREFGKGQSGGGKGKGGSGRPPPFFEVCEQAKALLDQGEAIPPALMAKVLKFKLLQIKQKDLDRREEEKKAAKAAEAAKKDDKGKKSRSPSGKRSKSPGKKKGKKDADAPASPKKDTKLKRRGDIEDTFKTIDDEPDDEGCPQHYVLIHGVLMAPVIQHLTDIGINVDSVICMKSETYDKFEHKDDQEGKEKATEELDPEELEKGIQEEEQLAQKKEFITKLENFWKESDSVVIKAPSGNKLKDIAKYEVVVRDKDIPEENLQELTDEKKTEFGTVLFEDVAVTCYNMLDHYSLYKQYLASMKLLHVPVHSTTVSSTTMLDVPASQSAQAMAPPVSDSQAPVYVEVDTRYYKHLMDTVPPESHSVPLMLHCMLEQVTATEDGSNPLDKETPPRDDGLNRLLAAHIDSKTAKLPLSQDDKMTAPDNVTGEKKPVNPSSPILLYHGDTITARTHHLKPLNNLDTIQVEQQMLQFTQSYTDKIPEHEGRESAERAACVNELCQFMKTKSVDGAILDQAMKQYAFEGMLLKSVDNEGDIIDPVELDDAFRSYTNPWDHPYSKLEDFMKVKFCSDDSGKLKISEIESSSPLTSFRNLDDWCFVEYFDRTTLLQVLEEARFTLPYVDTYYHKKDHSLLVALHNPIGQNSTSKTSWKTKLHSNVGFRNYLDNVATSINTWIDDQERMKIEAARTPTPPPVVIEEPPAPLKEGSRYGLVTRAEMNALKAEEEEKNKKGKGKKSARGTRSPGRGSAKSRAKDQSPDKKDKKREGSATSRPKSGRSSAKGSQRSVSSKDKKSRSRSRLGSQDDLDEPTPQAAEPQVEETFDFIGYDVGDNLVHASGSLMTLFPSDGGQIRVDKSSYVQGSKSVRVSVYKDGNTFILHFLEPVDEVLPKDNSDEEQADKQEIENKTDEQPQEHIEKSEIEGNEKESLKSTRKKVKPICDFSSFVAQFSDGMTMTHSGYGPSGSIMDGEPNETEAALTVTVPEAGTTAHGTPSPQPKASSPKARKKMDEEAKRMEELLQQQEEEKQRVEEEAKKRAEEERNKKPFQHVYISCPDGLHVEYFNDGQYASSGDKGGVGVRQRYPVKGLGKQECETLRQKPAMEELSRTVLTNGTVIKFMKDNGVQVLFPDGATSKCQLYPSQERPSSAAVNKPAESSPTKKGLRATPQKLSEDPPVPVLSLPDKVPQWISTGIGGARVGTKENGEIESLDGVLYSLATCTETGQVLRTREDNVVTIERPDGSTVVEHEDGTRITTFYHQIERQTQVPDNETGIEAQYDMYQGKFVKVECPGFATLVFNLNEGSCGTVFGNGVNIETCADGVTTMDRLDGSQLHIDAKGIISFAPRELAEKIDLAAPEPSNKPAETPAGIYVMRSNDQVCCELKDTRGTQFTVMSNGETSINKPPSQTDETSSNGPLTSLVPRYFGVYQDGSGFELLRQSDVNEFLCEAEKEPSCAVLKSPVEGVHQATGITVLKPYSGGVVNVWFMSKDEDIIVPQALRERDFETFPAKEEKRDGPKFGTNVGSGLNIGAVIKKPPAPRPITCPKALELRQLIQYKPLTNEQRQTIVASMKDYGEYVNKRQDKLDSILPQDPRDDSEKLRAKELSDKAEDDNLDMELEKNQEDGIESTDTITKTKDMLNKLQGDEVSSKYIEAITPAPEPVPSPPCWKRSKSEWERDKIELAELEYGKHALRNKEVPPYFDTSSGQSFLRLEYGSDDINMNELTSQLAEQTRHPPPGEGSVPDTPDSVTIQKSLQDYSSPEVLQQSGGTSSQLNNDTVSPSANTLSPNNLRPTNPTPAHATGDGTPTPLRPNNPTPAHATYKPVRPSNPTPKHAADQSDGQVTGTESPNYDNAQWRSNLESVQEVVQHDDDNSKNEQSENSDGIIDTPGNPMVGAKSLYVDVTGTMRKDTVKLPASILSSKPGALPNTQFIEVEDPVRRRVNTVSVAGGNKVAPGRVEGLRGFELLPPKISFGVLKEGCTYIHSVLMKNVGIDSCRFKIRQPPPSTGLRVLYNPGPVAAGMNTKLDIEIFAVAVGVVGETGVGQVGHHVEIVTETDVIYLPVYATIMTAYEYEGRYGNQANSLNTGTTLIPNRPPSRDPTRPRKPEDYALLNQTDAAS